MARSTPAAALALIAALALAACSAGSAPEPSSASDPTPAPTTVVETEASVESESPESAADAEAELVQQLCEVRVQGSFADRGVRLATPEDTAAVAQALTMPVLPGRATCGGVMDDESYTQLIWVDQPLVAPDLLEVFGSRGWETVEEQATGYAITVYEEGTFTVSVAPVGVDNVMSAWGGIWPGMDVTILGFERQ